MERVTFEEYEAAKAAVLYGKEYEETSSMENNVIHKQYVCWKIIQGLQRATVFWVSE